MKPVATHSREVAHRSLNYKPLRLPRNPNNALDVCRTA
jgi:hypothetical protein